jgi:hypothetical protein
MGLGGLSIGYILERLIPRVKHPTVNLRTIGRQLGQRVLG